MFGFHSKLMLTCNKIFQHLDFCQAFWLIEAVKLISPLIQIQEPTTLAMLFLFVQLGSSEEFKYQCHHAWLQSKTQEGPGRSKPPETCGYCTTQSSEMELCESIPEMAPTGHACLQEEQGKQWSLLGLSWSHTFLDDKWGTVFCACPSLRLFFLLLDLFSFLLSAIYITAIMQFVLVSHRYKCFYCQEMLAIFVRSHADTIFNLVPEQITTWHYMHSVWKHCVRVSNTRKLELCLHFKSGILC